LQWVDTMSTTEWKDVTTMSEPSHRTNKLSTP
jgi:hypothetical protein